MSTEKLATTPDNTRIALINNNIDYMRADISEIKQSIKELAGVYPTRQDLKEVSDKVAALERQNSLMKIVSPAVASLITGAIMFLLINFLQRH